MKTRNIILAASLTGMLLTGTAFNTIAQTTDTVDTAATPNKLRVLEIKPMQFRVSYIQPQSNTVIVRILNTDRTILFSENKRIESNYLRYFDLSTLTDGTYTFEVTDGKEKYTQSFDILTKTSRVVSSIN